LAETTYHTDYRGTERETAKDGFEGSSFRLKNLLGLLAGILAIVFFGSVFLPWVSTWPSVKPLIDYIEETDIDPRGLFYTESEEALETYSEMVDSFRFSPQKKMTQGHTKGLRKP